MAQLDTHEEIIKCTLCKEDTMRIRRKSYMRLFPYSRHIYCTGCHERFFVVFGMHIKLRRTNILL